jgi:hypothetical protein
MNLTKNNRMAQDMNFSASKLRTSIMDENNQDHFGKFGSKNYNMQIPLKNMAQSPNKKSQKTNWDNMDIHSFKKLYDRISPLNNLIKIDNKNDPTYESANMDNPDIPYTFNQDYEENDPFIKEIAHNITKDLKDPSRTEITKVVFEWVVVNVDYEKPVYYQSKHYASNTAKLGKGNCCDQARLVIALCRASGIPRTATIFYHSDSVKMLGGKIVGHVWPVVILENDELLICDTSSYNSALGSPGWQVQGYIDQQFNLKY